jgi:hypothetical protein
MLQAAPMRWQPCRRKERASEIILFFLYWVEDGAL